MHLSAILKSLVSVPWFRKDSATDHKHEGAAPGRMPGWRSRVRVHEGGTMRLNRTAPARSGIATSLFATALATATVFAASSVSANDCSQESGVDCRAYLADPNVLGFGAIFGDSAATASSAPPDLVVTDFGAEAEWDASITLSSLKVFRWDPDEVHPGSPTLFGRWTLVSDWDVTQPLATAPSWDVTLPSDDRPGDRSEAITGLAEDPSLPHGAVVRDYCLVPTSTNFGRTLNPTGTDVIDTHQEACENWSPSPSDLTSPRNGELFYISWVHFDYEANFPEELRFSGWPSDALRAGSADSLKWTPNGDGNRSTYTVYVGTSYTGANILQLPRPILGLLPTSPNVDDELRSELQGTLPQGLGFTPRAGSLADPTPGGTFQGTPAASSTGTDFEIRYEWWRITPNAKSDATDYFDLNLKFVVEEPTENSVPHLYAICDDATAITGEAIDDATNACNDAADDLEGLEAERVASLEAVAWVAGENLNTEERWGDTSGGPYNWYGHDSTLVDPDEGLSQKQTLPSSRLDRLWIEQRTTHEDNDSEGLIYWIQNVEGAHASVSDAGLDNDVLHWEAEFSWKRDGTAERRRAIQAIVIDDAAYAVRGGDRIELGDTGLVVELNTDAFSDVAAPPWLLSGRSSKDWTIGVKFTVQDGDSPRSDMSDLASIEYELDITNEAPDWGSVTGLTIEHPENNSTDIVGTLTGPLSDLLRSAVPYPYGSPPSHGEHDYQLACVTLQNVRDAVSSRHADQAVTGDPILLVNQDAVQVDGRLHYPASSFVSDSAAQDVVDTSESDLVGGVLINSGAFTDFEVRGANSALDGTSDGWVEAEYMFDIVAKDVAFGNYDGSPEDEPDAVTNNRDIGTTVCDMLDDGMQPMSVSARPVTVTVKLTNVDEAPMRHPDFDATQPDWLGKSGLYMTESSMWDPETLQSPSEPGFSWNAPNVNTNSGDTLTVNVAEEDWFWEPDVLSADSQNNQMELFVYRNGTLQVADSSGVLWDPDSEGNPDTTSGGFLTARMTSSGQITVSGGTESTTDMQSYEFYVDLKYDLKDDDPDAGWVYVSSSGGEDHAQAGSTKAFTLNYRSENTAPGFGGVGASCLDDETAPWVAFATPENRTNWQQGTGETVANSEGPPNYYLLELVNGGLDESDRGNQATPCRGGDADSDRVWFTTEAYGASASNGWVYAFKSTPRLTSGAAESPAGATERLEIDFGSAGESRSVLLAGKMDDTTTVYENLDYEGVNEFFVRLKAMDIFGDIGSMTVKASVGDRPERVIADSESAAYKESSVFPMPRSHYLVALDPDEESDDMHEGKNVWSIDLGTSDEQQVVARESRDAPVDAPDGSTLFWDPDGDVYEYMEVDDLGCDTVLGDNPTIDLTDGVLTVSAGTGSTTAARTCDITVQVKETGTGHDETAFTSETVTFQFDIKQQNEAPNFGNLTKLDFVWSENEQGNPDDGFMRVTADDPDGDVNDLEYSLWDRADPDKEIPSTEWKAIRDDDYAGPTKPGVIEVVGLLDKEYDENVRQGYIDESEGPQQYTALILGASDLQDAMGTVNVDVDVLEAADLPKLRIYEGPTEGTNPAGEATTTYSTFADGFCMVTSAPTGPEIQAEHNLLTHTRRDQDLSLEATCHIGRGQSIDINWDELFWDEDCANLACTVRNEVRIESMDVTGVHISVTDDAIGSSVSISGLTVTGDDAADSLRIIGLDGVDSSIAHGDVNLTVVVGENTPPVIAVNPPAHIEVRESETYRLDLDDYFSDADLIDLGNLTYEYYISNVYDEGETGEEPLDLAHISVTQDGSVLTVSGDTTGPAAIHVMATDTVGNTSPEGDFLFDVLVPAVALVATPALPDLPAEGDPEIFAGSVVAMPEGNGIFNIGSMAMMEYVIAPEEFADDLMDDRESGGDVTFVPHKKGEVTVTVTGSNDDGTEGSDCEDGSVICAVNHSVSIDFMITVSNTAPTIAMIESKEGLKAGDMFEVMPDVMDVDGDEVVVSLGADNEVVMIDHDTMMVTAWSAGTSMVTVTADDGDDGVTTLDFTVSIDNSEPALGAFEAMDMLIGTDVEVTVTGSDADMLQTLTYSVMSTDEAVATVMSCSPSEDDPLEDPDDSEDTEIDGECFQVDARSVGTSTITVDVSDDWDPSAMATNNFTVNVLNTSPEIMLSKSEHTIWGVEHVNDEITVSASDADGHGVTLEVESSDIDVATAMLVEPDLDDVAEEDAATVVSITTVSVGEVTLTVTGTDDFGAMSRASVAVIVKNTMPEISFDEEQEQIVIVGVGEVMDVGYTASDADGDMLTLAVTSDNVDVATVMIDEEMSMVSVSSTGVGDAVITATADDSRGEDNTASATLQVTVSNRAPMVSLSASSLSIAGVGMVNETVTVTASDADGHDLNISVASDNESVVTASLMASDDPLGDPGPMMLQITTEGHGSATVTVTAKDNLESVGEASVDVEVTNTRPEISLAMEELTIDGVGTSMSVGFEASDADGDEFTLSAVAVSDESESAFATATIDMMDEEVDVTSTGVGETTITVTIDDGWGREDSTASAMLKVTVNNRDPEVSLSASSLSIAGVGNINETVTVTATDADGHDLNISVSSDNESVVTASLMDSDDPLGDPGATLLRITTEGHGSAMVTVTATDNFNGVGQASVVVEVTNTRPEISLAMEELTIDGVGTSMSVGFEASDADGDEFTLSAVAVSDESESAFATATIDMMDEEVDVTSTGVGETTITVTVDDGWGRVDSTASAMLMVTVNNRDPVVSLNQSEVTITGVGETATLGGTATDPDGHSLTLSASSSDMGVASAAVSASEDAITLTVSSHSVGSAVITITAADAFGGSGSATATFSVANRAPTIALSPTSLTIDGVGETGSTTVTASDPDEHDVEISWESSDSAVATATMSGTTLTVTSHRVGNATITVTADDGQTFDSSASAELSIQVDNRLPTLSVSPTSVSIIAGGNVASATLTMDDPDGQSLSVSASSSDSVVVTPSISGSRLTMTSGAPGTATISLEVNDGAGGTADATVSVNVTNRAPAITAMPDMTIQLGGEPGTMNIVVDDADGHAYDLSVNSANTGVATVTRVSATLTINAVDVGTSVITVTATDPYEASSSASFTVTVSDSELKTMAGKSIAALGRVHIASVASALEGRMAGALSAAGGRTAAEDLVDRFAKYMPIDLPVTMTQEPRGGFQSQQGQSGAVALFEDDSNAASLQSGRDFSLGAMLGLRDLTKGFNLNLGQVMGANLGLWGSVDNQSYEGMDYDGGLTNFWIGADMAMESDLMIGLAIGRSSGESDYTFGTHTRTLEATFTSFMPYVGMTPDDQTAVWGAFAFGSGELETAGDMNDLSVSTGLIGGRRGLDFQMMEGMDIAVKGDFGFNTIETEEGSGAAGGLEASVSRLRVAVEGSWISEVAEGQSFEPFVDVGFRNDGGDGDTGSGVEVGGGVRLCADNFKLEARFHVTTQHAAEEYSESGFGVVASVNPNNDGSGLAMSITPSWGSAGAYADTMFSNEASIGQSLGQVSSFGSQGESLDANVSYGFKLSRDRMILTPFVDLRSSVNRSSLQLGARLSNLIATSSAFDLALLAGMSESEGERRNELGLKGHIRF